MAVGVECPAEGTGITAANCRAASLSLGKRLLLIPSLVLRHVDQLASDLSADVTRNIPFMYLVLFFPLSNPGRVLE